MKKFYSFLIAVFIFSFSATQSFAGLTITNQSIKDDHDHVMSTDPALIETCREYYFTVTIANTAGNFTSTDTIRLNVTLPSGILLDSLWSSNGTVINGNPIVITGITGVNVDTFRYGIIAQCNLFSQSTTSSLRDTISAWINLTGPTIHASQPYDVNSPWIIFNAAQSVNMVDSTAPFLVPFSRNYSYKNRGIASFHSNFYWRDTLQYDFSQAVLYLDSAKVIYPSTNTVYFQSFSDTSLELKVRMLDSVRYDDSIVIQEWVHLVGCPNSNSTINYSKAHADFFYGCSDTTMCAHVAADETYALTQDRPNLQLMELNAFNQTPVPLDTVVARLDITNIDWLCPSRDELRVLCLVNIGTGIADSVKMRLDRQAPNGISYFESDSVHVYRYSGGILIPETIVDTSTVYSAGGFYIPAAYPITYKFSIADTIHYHDTIIVTYLEKKICLDTATASSFNHGVVMNDIGFSATLTHPCFPSTAGFGNSNRGLWGRPSQIFSLGQFFENHSAMIGDSESVWLDIRNTSELQLNYNSVPFNMPLQQEVAIDTANFRIQVEVALQPGLEFFGDSIYLISFQSPANDTLFPVSIVTVHHCGIGDTLLATFKLPSNFFIANPTTYHSGWGYSLYRSSAYERFFNDFAVQFKLRARCNCPPPPGGFSGVTQNFYAVYDNSCNPVCRFPLSSVSNQLQVHCPGCQIPGWNLSRLDIHRLNFGWADIQNDNHPDVLVVGNPVDTALHPPANEERIMMGDTIEVHIQGSTSDGDSLSFAGAGFPFKYQWFNFSGSLPPYLAFIGGHGTLDAGAFTIPHDSMLASNTLLDLSISNLQAWRTSGTIPDSINQGDVIDLYLKFVDSLNLINGSNYFDVYNMPAIFYMSGVDRNHFDSVAPPGGNGIPELSPADRARMEYYCTGWEGRVTGIGVDFGTTASTLGYIGSWGFGQIDPCYKQIIFNGYHTLGEKTDLLNEEDITNQLALNSFAYEVHDFMLLDSLSMTIPTGWHVDSIRVNMGNLMRDSLNFTRYICSDYYLCPPALIVTVGQNVTVHLDTVYKWLTSPALYDVQCRHLDTLDKGDETKRIWVSAILKMNSCATPDTVILANDTLAAYFENIRQHYYRPPYDTLLANTILPSTAFYAPRPNLTAQVTPQNQTVTATQFTTNLTISADIRGYDIDHCSHAFVYPYSPNGNFTVNSITRLSNNTLLPLVDTVGGQLYGIGIIRQVGWGASGPVSMNVSLNYQCSDTITHDTLYFIYGCNCYNYPTIGTLATACTLDTIKYFITINPPGLQVTMTTDSVFQPCDTLTLTMHFISTGIGAITHVLDSVRLVAGTSYVANSGIVSYDSSSTAVSHLLNPTLIPAGLIWNFDSIPVIADSLGELISDFYLTFRLATDCKYNIIDVFNAHVNALSYCGGNIHIAVHGAPQTYSLNAFARDTIVISSITCYSDSVQLHLDVQNVSGYTNFINEIAFAIDSNYLFTVNNLSAYDTTLRVGMPDTTITLHYIRGGNFCTTDTDIVRALLSLHAQFSCHGEVPCDKVVASDSASCSFIYSHTVAVNAGNDTSVCGFYTELCASNPTGGTPPYSFLWNDAETTQCIWVAPASTTSYIVTATDSIGCLATDTVIVTVPDSCHCAGIHQVFVYSDGDETICLNDTVTICSYPYGGSGVYYYLWNTGVGTQCISVSPSDTTLYTITVTDTAGCSATTSLTITPAVCVPGCPPVDTVLTNPVASSLGSSLSGRTVLIQGTFTVDTSFLIINCNVYMDAGAKIIIQGLPAYNPLLYLNSSSVQACDTMWDRIEITAGGALYIWRSSISDANCAVYAKDTTTFKITDSRFVNNVTSIETATHSSTGYNNISYVIIANLFVGGGGFLPDYAGQPAHGNYPKAGIYFNSMFGSIGSRTANPNYFRGMNWGIYANNSSLTITNNQFSEIHHYDTIYHNQFAGSAIAAYSSIGLHRTVYVEPLNSYWGFWTMINCDYGFYGDVMNVGIKSVNMDNVTTGVYITHCFLGRTFGMTNCVINAIKQGVHLHYNPHAGGMTVSHSNITTTETHGGVCILADNYLQASSNLIIDNNITISAGSVDGIRLINHQGGIVQGNEVVCDHSSRWTGISQNGCDKNYISCNNAYRTSFGGNTWAYRSVINSNTTMSCNLSNYTRIGIEFDGINSGTTFKSNVINHHWEGLRLDSSGIMGQQLNKGNTFIGGYTSSFGGDNLNSSFVGLFSNRFFVDSISNPFLWANTPAYDTTWFVPLPGTEDTCDSRSDCSWASPLVGVYKISKADSVVSADGAITVAFIDESKEMGKQFLFEQLKASPELLDSSEVMADFYEAQLTSQIGAMSFVKEKINVVQSYDSSFAQVIDSLHLLTKDLLDSSVTLDSMFAISENDSSLIAAKQSIKVQMEGIQGTLTSLLASRNLAVQPQATLATATSTNDGTTATGIPEINEKAVNSIFVRTIALDSLSFTQGQQDSLYEIAHQCPLSGGIAVFSARVLYELINPDEEYDDSTACSSYGYRSGNALSMEPKQYSQFSLKPNPASESVTVNFKPSGKDTQCLLLITDLTGKTIREIELPCNKSEYLLSLNDMVSGMYIVKMTSNGNLVGKAKLAVTK